MRFIGRIATKLQFHGKFGNLYESKLTIDRIKYRSTESIDTENLASIEYKIRLKIVLGIYAIELTSVSIPDSAANSSVFVKCIVLILTVFLVLGLVNM
jgi:hypothetical protein